MGFNEFISKVFGNKATRDMKEIQPWVNKVKEVYPEIQKLTKSWRKKSSKNTRRH